jgi:mono/diheme cytochrome c family protein
MSGNLVLKSISFLSFAVLLALSTTGLAASSADLAQGQQVFDHWCAPCHGAGKGKPGTDALAAKYADGSEPALLEQRTDLDPAVIEAMVRQGVSIMPIFRKTEISNADLRAMVAYLTKAHR